MFLASIPSILAAASTHIKLNMEARVITDRRSLRYQYADNQARTLISHHVHVVRLMSCLGSVINHRHHINILADPCVENHPGLFQTDVSGVLVKVEILGLADIEEIQLFFDQHRTAKSYKFHPRARYPFQHQRSGMVRNDAVAGLLQFYLQKPYFFRSVILISIKLTVANHLVAAPQVISKAEEGSPFYRFRDA